MNSFGSLGKSMVSGTVNLLTGAKELDLTGTIVAVEDVSTWLKDLRHESSGLTRLPLAMGLFITFTFLSIEVTDVVAVNKIHYQMSNRFGSSSDEFSGVGSIPELHSWLQTALFPVRPLQSP